MRLLQYNNDGEFSLTKDLMSDDIPNYAILSHTWGPDTEEVTYRDMIEGTGKNKIGYEKIRFCGEQAKRDRLEYFWVDTCCINKANYAELQYALNSMFCWYRNATRCYVYFRGIRNFGKADGLPGGGRSKSFLPLVEFFSREHVRLGDKNELKQQIQGITSIPISALQGAPLSQFSVDERFSWMERRQTSLEVDRVYSLLGILDVKIPLFKDTEAATAFERLQKIIDKRGKCIQDLRLTDPCHDKKRIENTKGGLLKDSYRWVFGTSEFKQWRSDQLSPLLWIKGDPGKGKTMLLCGIINELSISTVDTALLSYFFCQATDSRINNATSVLRGLIYMVVEQQPSLVSHVQKKYDKAGKALFKDANAWTALSEIFTDILQDSSLDSIYLIVDALDECVTGLQELLELVVSTSLVLSRAKWIVSSRNWSSIERSLNTAAHGVRLSLELNERSVAAAITIYIQSKVNWLAERNEYSSETRESVQRYLSLNANGTFLWVALVCKELSKIPGWKATKKVTAFPPELNPFYRRMMDQIRGVEDAEDGELCTQILAVVSAVYRPVLLNELPLLIDLPDGVASDDYKALSDIVGLCGSFLTLREHTISFVHQSAKDFLIKEAQNEIYPCGVESVHNTIFSRSLQAMSRIVQRDIYGLRTPGISIDQVTPPEPDPLVALRYSCLYWVDHLIDCHTSENKFEDLQDSGPVYVFLCHSFLFWLEALSLIGSLSNGIVAIRKLENWLQAQKCPDLYAFVHDAKRFALLNRLVIEQTPLQLYCSALVFAPKKSIVRRQFEDCIPDWIQLKPKVQEHWNAVLQTLEGHSSSVNSVAFSPDGKQVASGSRDNTIRLWDAATGASLQTLKGHSDWVTSVAFSPNGKHVISGSYDSTIRLWDAARGASLQTLMGHSDSVNSVAFSPDGKQVVSGSGHDTIRFWSGYGNNTIRLWDAATGASLQTLEGHSDSVNSVAFSPNGKQVVSGSGDSIIRLWDTNTGALLQTLKGHLDWVSLVAFSPNGKQIVSGSHDSIIRLWDVATGASLQTLQGHLDSVNSVAFSPNSKQVVSGSSDSTIRLWDAATGALLQTLEDHLDPVNSVAFSPDGKQVVSGSNDNITRLWDAAIGASLQTLEGHSDPIFSMAFSPDGKQVASGSYDITIRLWDVATGASLQTLMGHSDSVTSVAFSPNSKQVVSGSDDNTIRLWDAATGASLQTLKGHLSSVNSVAFSPNGKQVVSGSSDNTIQLWDAATGALLQTITGHSDSVNSVAFSPNSKQVVSGSYDNTIRLWDAATGALLQTLTGRSDSVNSVAFSPNGKQVVSGSDDNIIWLWDAATGALLQTLTGHSDSVSSVAFSPDGKLESIILVSGDWVVEGERNILWLPLDYRAFSSATWNRTLVIGHLSGKVSFFCFEKAKLII